MNIEPEIRCFRAFGVSLQSPLSLLLHETTVMRWVEQKSVPFSCASGPIFFFHLTGKEIPSGTILGFEFESSLFYALLDRLQGGNGKFNVNSLKSRPMTHLEKRLASRFLLLFQNAIRETWNLPEPFDFEPFSSAELEPERKFIVAEFQLDAGNLSGTIRLWRLAPFRTKSDDLENADSVRDVASSLAQTPVHIAVQLSGEKITPKELMKWRENDLISLGRPEDFPFSVLVEGVEKFTASPGKFKSRKAFRILNRLETSPSESPFNSNSDLAKTM